MSSAKMLSGTVIVFCVVLLQASQGVSAMKCPEAVGSILNCPVIFMDESKQFCCVTKENMPFCCDLGDYIINNTAIIGGVVTAAIVLLLLIILCCCCCCSCCLLAKRRQNRQTVIYAPVLSAPPVITPQQYPMATAMHSPLIVTSNQPAYDPPSYTAKQ